MFFLVFPFFGVESITGLVKHLSFCLPIFALQLNYMHHIIETERLRLIACSMDILEAIFESNEKLASVLNVHVPDKWAEFGEPPFRFTYNKLKKNNNDFKWWTYLTVHNADNKLIGSCGYKGKPDEKGMIEIGYEIKKEYHNKGLATETAKALIDHAFKNGKVKIAQAHTLPEKNASVNVLKKCGMIFIKEVNDPEDGLIWQWQCPGPKGSNAPNP
jgi:[ribosomal protein S5]-alanine N-acetyltransferase